MLTGKKLRVLFQEFNGSYFSGKLPTYSLRAVDRRTWLHWSGRCNPKRRLIEIQRGLPDAEAISTLLHEMAHAATYGGHGMKWKAEMIRLREAGAPFISPDADVRLEDWDGIRVTKLRFRIEIQDVIESRPDITLKDALRGFIYEVGGPATVTEFLRKYPWVRAELKAAQKEHTEALERAATFRRKFARARS